MDLTIPLETVTLNIRVAVLIQKDGGFVLEKSKGGYYFPVGGRVKQGETSEEAARREVLEELGVTTQDLQLRGVIELFFGRENDRVQEICFVYTASVVGMLELAQEFGVHTVEQIESIDFRPQVIKEIMKSKEAGILHITMRE